MRLRYFILILSLGFSTKFYAQEVITEQEYLKLDSLLWLDYEKQQNQLGTAWEVTPDKRDSLQKASDQLLEEIMKRNEELAIKYASVPSGLHRLYKVRLTIAKDTLKKVFSSLTQEMQNSYIGKNIWSHLQTKQIEVGDTLQPFPCIQDNGKDFDWSAYKGKQLLLLYEGLGCMGESGRQYLKQLYEKTSRKDLMVVVYWHCDSLPELQEIKQYYSADYIFITDFRREDSPIKIKYGTQATPTCFLTDSQHRVLVKCEGLNPILIKPHLKIIP